MSVNTVRKHLVSLVEQGLITNESSLVLNFQDDERRKFFTLPNEIFLLDLPPAAFMVYAYLLLIEDRRTHACHPSYSTVAAETGISKNTAMKSISILLEVGLITAESSSYFDKHGMKWKGNNLYTILPIGNVMGGFYHHQFRQLELDKARRKGKARLSRRCAPCVASSEVGRSTPPPP